jgi:hypothetical protein
MWNSNHQDVVAPHNLYRRMLSHSWISSRHTVYCLMWEFFSSLPGNFSNMWHEIFPSNLDTETFCGALFTWWCTCLEGPAAVGVSRVLGVTLSFIQFSSTGAVEAIRCSITHPRWNPVPYFHDYAFYVTCAQCMWQTSVSTWTLVCPFLILWWVVSVPCVYLHCLPHAYDYCVLLCILVSLLVLVLVSAICAMWIVITILRTPLTTRLH